MAPPDRIGDGARQAGAGSLSVGEKANSRETNENDEQQRAYMLRVDELHKHLLKCSDYGAQSDLTSAKNRIHRLAQLDALLSSRYRFGLASGQTAQLALSESNRTLRSADKVMHLPKVGLK